MDESEGQQEAIPSRARDRRRSVFELEWHRKRGKLIKKELTPHMARIVSDCFELLDEDGSGSLDADELETAFRFLGQPVKRSECVKMINEWDHDGNGTIEFDEFTEIMTNKMNPGEEEEEDDSKAVTATLPFQMLAAAYQRKRLIQAVMEMDHDTTERMTRGMERLGPSPEELAAASPSGEAEAENGAASPAPPVPPTRMNVIFMQEARARLRGMGAQLEELREASYAEEERLRNLKPLPWQEQVELKRLEKQAEHARKATSAVKRQHRVHRHVVDYIDHKLRPGLGAGGPGAAPPPVALPLPEPTDPRLLLQRVKQKDRANWMGRRESVRLEGRRRVSVVGSDTNAAAAAAAAAAYEYTILEAEDEAAEAEAEATEGRALSRQRCSSPVIEDCFAILAEPSSAPASRGAEWTVWDDPAHWRAPRAGLGSVPPTERYRYVELPQRLQARLAEAGDGAAPKRPPPGEEAGQAQLRKLRVLRSVTGGSLRVPASPPRPATALGVASTREPTAAVSRASTPGLPLRPHSRAGSRASTPGLGDTRRRGRAASSPEPSAAPEPALTGPPRSLSPPLSPAEAKGAAKFRRESIARFGRGVSAPATRPKPTVPPHHRILTTKNWRK